MFPQVSLLLALLLLMVLEGWKDLACLPSLLVMLRSPSSPSCFQSTSPGSCRSTITSLGTALLLLPHCSLANMVTSNSSKESRSAASSLS